MIKRDTGDTCRYKVFTVQGTIGGSWEKGGYRGYRIYTRIWDIQQKDDSVGKGIHNRFIYIVVSLVYKRYKDARVQGYK